jgi:RNA polymerase sigma-70 factor (ECF subfamily)
MELAQLEEKVIEEAKTGSQEAFESLVKQYLPIVYRYIARLTGDRHLAEELSQETFIRAWKNIGQFETGKPIKPWLMRIARNCAFDSLRKKKTVAFSSLSEPEQYRLENIPTKNLSPIELAEKREKKELVKNILDRLSENEREVLVLHYLEELTVPEIAQILNKQEETVRTRLRRARASFRGEKEKSEPVFDFRNVYSINGQESSKY